MKVEGVKDLKNSTVYSVRAMYPVRIRMSCKKNMFKIALSHDYMV